MSKNPWEGTVVTKTMLTPEMAQKIIRKMQDQQSPQRKARVRVVDAYARNMQKSKWFFTGDALRWDDHGNFIDGQHRCLAVIQSGVSIPVLLIRGLSRDVMAVIDVGPRRSFDDYLKIQGVHHYALSAAITTKVWFWLNGHFPSNGALPSLSNVEKEMLFWRFEAEISRSAEFIGRLSKIRYHVTPAIAGFLHFAVSTFGKIESVEFFLSRLVSGDDLGKASPILRLRNKLIEHKAQCSKLGAMNGRDWRVPYIYLILAWNAYVSREKVSFELVRNSNGAMVFPDISGINSAHVPFAGDGSGEDA